MMKEIKILGTGCQKCRLLEKTVREVVAEHHIEATVSKVEDIVEIMGYGVMTTPAIVVDNQVLMKGRVPSAKELLTMLNKG